MDSAKQVSSYQLDQEILDARGIDMTVEEVAGLPTCKYAERVQGLRLTDDDLAFLKGLRRRIKNRLASQNSRRRSMEHLRKLTRELRAVRACRDDALLERRALLAQRECVRGRACELREYVVQVLRSRSDPTEVPTIEPRIKPSKKIESQTQPKDNPKKITVTETKTPLIAECYKIERDKNIFECRLEKLVQQSVNHIYKEDLIKTDKKKIFAKTVFISNDKCLSEVKSINGLNLEGDIKDVMDEDCGEVLNLSVKKERRKSHGRKQSAPRRIAYTCDSDEGVLDLKIKKESQ